MVKLKHTEMQIIDHALDMQSGYVLDFSDRTMREFFDDEFRINIYDQKYNFNGTSKAKYLRAFIAVESASVVSKVLRRLWQYRSEIPNYNSSSNYFEAVNKFNYEAKFVLLLDKIEKSNDLPSVDTIERFIESETLDQLVDSIARDINADKPNVALDRLHTYCMKKFGHLLEKRGVEWEQSEPLNSRVGKYVKALQKERVLQDMTLQSIKSSISIFEKFNHIRNNQSLAHDNDLLDQAEARFIYDTVTALLRFVKSIEANGFDA